MRNRTKARKGQGLRVFFLSKSANMRRKSSLVVLSARIGGHFDARIVHFAILKLRYKVTRVVGSFWFRKSAFVRVNQQLSFSISSNVKVDDLSNKFD